MLHVRVNVVDELPSTKTFAGVSPGAMLCETSRNSESPGFGMERSQRAAMADNPMAMPTDAPITRMRITNGKAPSMHRLWHALHVGRESLNASVMLTCAQTFL
jgi:hypothetical protein